MGNQGKRVRSPFGGAVPKRRSGRTLAWTGKKGSKGLGVFENRKLEQASTEEEMVVWTCKIEQR